MVTHGPVNSWVWCTVGPSHTTLLSALLRLPLLSLISAQCSLLSSAWPGLTSVEMWAARSEHHICDDVVTHGHCHSWHAWHPPDTQWPCTTVSVGVKARSDADKDLTRQLWNKSLLSSHPEEFKSYYSVTESLTLHKLLIKLERKYLEQTLNTEQNWNHSPQIGSSFSTLRIGFKVFKFKITVAKLNWKYDHILT